MRLANGETTMPVLNVSTAYGGSEFIRDLYDLGLHPNNQEDEGMFFSRNGMVGMTTSGKSTSYPIQRVQRIEREQGKNLRCFMSSYVTGEPDVGYDKPASDNAQTLDRSYFDFKTVAIYGVALEIPEDQINREQAIPISTDYQKAQRKYWANLAEEALLFIGLCGIRGQAKNCEVFVNTQANAADAAAGKTSAMSEAVLGLHGANPIYPPQVQFAAWHAALNSGNALNVAGATAGGKASVSQVRAIRTWFSEQNRALRGGVSMEPGMFNVSRAKNGNKGNKNSTATDWIWMIPPAVLRGLLDETGDDTYARYQLAQVEGGAVHDTSWDNFEMSRLFGITTLVYRKMPRYLAGAGKNVPVARTMFLGRQAAVIGWRAYSIPEEYSARFKHMTKGVSDWGISIRTWVQPVNQGRKATLQSQGNIGVSPMYWTTSNGTRIDKGRVAYDCAVPTIIDSTV